MTADVYHISARGRWRGWVYDGAMQHRLALLRLGDSAAYAVPRSAGTVHVELVAGGAASWEGFRDVSFVAIHERFEPNRLFGFAQEVPSRTIHVLVPRDPNATEISLRISVSPDRLGAPVTTTRTIPIGGEPVGASTAPLVAAGPDVAGRREGLCGLLGIDFCGAEAFCGPAGECIPEACLPHDAWDNSLEELHAGSTAHVVFIPVGWGDPDSFTDYVRQVAEQIFADNDWFADNEDRWRFSAWQADCHYGAADPDSNDRGAVLDWISGLYGNTRLIPSHTKLVAVGAGGACSGVTYMLADQVALVQCGDARQMAEVLAHELGHAFGGLVDEYPYEDEIAECDSDHWQFGYPNHSFEGDIKWKCAAQTEGDPVFFGQDCGDGAEGSVGAWPRSGRCENAMRPCAQSIMRHHWGTAQFDVVGRAAMSHMLEDNALMTYESCAASVCDDSCTAFTTGMCGNNDCGRLCNSCDSAMGQACVWEGGWMCGMGCPEPTDICFDGLGQEHCPGDRYIVDPDGCGSGVPLFATCTGDTERCDGANCQNADTLVQCDMLAGCAWYACANECYERNTTYGEVCPSLCSTFTDLASCNTNDCAWYACGNACRARGTPIGEVCP